VKIVVDRAKCMGSGNCAFFAPNTFDLDDELKVVVLDPGGDSPDDLDAAVAGCPTRALSLAPGEA